tara:strand:- start:500 stop:838 length:339 start_codon:yes stop_codon:yes gene_type:complete
MSKCIKCGSYAFNLYKEGIDQGGFCDVHYWQGRAHRAEALAEQPAQQEPVAKDNSNYRLDQPGLDPLYTSPPPQRTWVSLTDEERTEIRREHYARTLPLMAAVEAKLKEKNT